MYEENKLSNQAEVAVTNTAANQEPEMSIVDRELHTLAIATSAARDAISALASRLKIVTKSEQDEGLVEKEPQETLTDLPSRIRDSRVSVERTIEGIEYLLKNLEL